MQRKLFEVYSGDFFRVFMRTGMREIPNAYGAPPARVFSRER